MQRVNKTETRANTEGRSGIMPEAHLTFCVTLEMQAGN